MVKRQALRTWGLVVVLGWAVSLAADDSQIGREVAVSRHLADGEELTTPLPKLLEYGRKLFSANWTADEGGGRPLTKGTGAPLSDASHPLVFPRNFNRISGPDSNSCAGCHNAPFGIPGGGGDIVANVFVLGQRFDFASFDGNLGGNTGNTVGSIDESGGLADLDHIANSRATLGMFGSGYIEMLARQITADLQAIRDKIPPGGSAPLVSSGISFGTLTHKADGRWDTSAVEGLPAPSLVDSPPNLILRPFHQAANVISIRQFTNNAFNHHHGIQAEERFGVGVDADGDGFINELTRADVTAVTMYQATMAVPGRVIPRDPDVEEAVLLGEKLFEQVGCQSCHIPALPLRGDNRLYSEPNPYNPAGNLRPGEAPVLSVNLNSPDLPGPRLRLHDGVTLVPAYTDLKLHDITSGPGDPNRESLDMNQAPGSPGFFAGNGKFLTRKLWGTANEPPFFHHGKYTTLRQAVLAHAGEAQTVSDRFKALAPHEQDAVIEFLKTLQVLPPGTTALVVDENGKERPWPPARLSPRRETAERSSGQRVREAALGSPSSPRETAVPAAPARSDVVIDWDNQLLAAIQIGKTPPPIAARAMAMVHVAIFNAVNGILGGYAPYGTPPAAPPVASPEVAAAAAAHRVLVTLFPDQREAFDAALVSSLAALPDGVAKNAGVSWGRSVADQIINLRSGDRSTEGVDYTTAVGSSWWVRTPPNYDEPALPNWPFVKPWAMASGSQFRQGAPPPVGCPEYAQAFNEIKQVGRADSPTRTAEQTQIARFWADGSGTVTPPGHWLLIAQGISKARHLTLAQNARLFALLGITLADAAIVAWDSKYYYNLWRPITAIQHAETDGNPDTEVDPSWTPLLATPPFPTYTSGHSTFSGAASKLLELFFGTDAISFTTESDSLPGVQRSFTSLSQAAAEAGQSRIYGGIHWQFDNQAGLASGRNLAPYVFVNYLTPVGSPSICRSGPGTLCLGPAGRFRAEVAWKSATNSGGGHAVPKTATSGDFWFFGSDILDLDVQVLEACFMKSTFWVYVQGVTDAEVLLTVTDTKTGRSRQYHNPRGKVFEPVKDKQAFPCP